jgi:hypothetical protein
VLTKELTMNHQTKVARRTLLRKALAASAVIPLAGIPIILRADDHRVDEAHPSAVALGYRHDAADVDTQKFPARATPEGKKQFCSNCKLYQSGSDGWGGCAIFPGKQVKGMGWCGAWISS